MKSSLFIIYSDAGKIPSPKKYTNITCAPQFFSDNGTCLAKCPNWSQDGPVVSKTEVIIAIISQSMGLTAGGIHLLVSMFSCKATYVYYFCVYIMAECQAVSPTACALGYAVTVNCILLLYIVVHSGLPNEYCHSETLEKVYTIGLS